MRSPFWWHNPRWMSTVPAVAAALIAAIWTPASALDIKSIEGRDAAVSTISLTGRVEEGDSLKVRSFVGNLPQGKPILAELTMGGGNIPEAIAIGRYFNQIKVRTYVPSRANCTSPCPLVLVGGRDPVTDKPSYYKHSTGGILFTSRTLNYQEKDYTVVELNNAIAGAQRNVLGVADYLRAVGANMTLLKHFESVKAGATSTPLTNEEALDLGIAVLDDKTGTLIPPTVKR